MLIQVLPNNDHPRRLRLRRASEERRPCSGGPIRNRDRKGGRRTRMDTHRSVLPDAQIHERRRRPGGPPSARRTDAQGYGAQATGEHR